MTRSTPSSGYPLDCLSGRIAFFGKLDFGTKGRVGDDEIKAIRLKSAQLVGFCRHFGDGLQAVEGNDVGVAVVVDDHVHLGGAGNAFGNLDAEQVALGKVVPVSSLNTSGSLARPF